MRADVSIVKTENGRDLLQVVWDTSSPGYYLLPISTNAKYELEVQAGVDNSEDVIDLGDGKKYYTDNTAGANFTKTINTTDANASAAAELRNLLTKEQKEAFKFSLQNVFVAKDPANKTADEFEDEKGLVRNKDTGAIVYVGPQNLTVDLSDMTWDEEKKHYYFNFTERLKPTNDSIIVQETARPEKLAGYTWNQAASVTEATSAAKLTGGSNLYVSLVNTYTEDQAKLKINKAFGEDSDIKENLGTNRQNNIQFTVQGTKANGQAYGPVTYTYAQLKNMNWELNLPAGTYRVTEINSISDFDWAVTYEAGIQGGTMASGSAASPATSVSTGNVQVDGGETGVFSFTNTYEQHTGNIRLNKTVVGVELTQAQKNNLTFSVNKKGNQNTLLKWTKVGNQYVYDPAGTVEQIPYTAFVNGSITLTGLPVGTYEVLESEVNINGYTRVTNVQVNSGTVREAYRRSYDVNLGKDETDVVKYTNTYTENASIKVQKTVTGDRTLSNVKDTLKFTLQKKNANGQWVDVSGKTNVSPNNNGVIDWTGLEFGEYRVIETATRPANFDMTTEVAVNPSAGATLNHNNKEATFTLSASSYNPTVTFTNDYTRKTTELDISKTLIGAPDGATDKIKFTVKQGATTAKWTKVTDTEYRYDPNGAVTNIPYAANIKLTNLPAGFTYTVTENTGSYTGSYIITTTANSNAGTSASVTLQETNGNVNTGDVDFVNSYKPIAKIKIEKTFTGVLSNAYVNAEILPKLRFVVSTKGDQNETLYRTESGTWVASKDAAKEFSYTELSTGLELEANKTYYIEELNAEVTGFTVSTWWNAGTTGNPTEVTGSNLPNVTVNPGDEPTINFINDYRAGGEIIGPSAQLHTKTWSGLTQTEENKVKGDVRFKLEYKDGNSWVTYDTYTLTELTDGKKTYENPDGTTKEEWIYLPAGQYRLTEQSYAVSGYDHEVFITIVEDGNLNYATTALMENKQVEFNVAAGSTYQFGLANVYTPKGALAVRKVIEGVDGNYSKHITFKLTRKLGENGAEDPNFGMVFNLSDFTNGVYTVSNLPTGDYLQNGADWNFIDYYYIVEETGASVDQHTLVSTTVKVNDGEATASGSATVKLEKGTSASDTIEFTNTYAHHKGALTVQKDIVGQVPDADAKKITFQLKDSAGNVIKWNVVDNKNVFVEGNAGTKSSFTYADMEVVNNQRTFTITNLDTGTYTLVESNADFPYFTRTTVFSIAGNGNESGAIQIGENAAVTVTVTNTYEPVGDLKLTKTVVIEGQGFDEAWQMLGAFNTIKFELHREGYQGNPVGTIHNLWGMQPKKISANEWEFTYTWTNLTPGVYTLVEKNTTIAGYNHNSITVTGADRIADVDGFPAFKVEVTSNGGAAIEVGLVNTYKEQGKLTISKTISGIDAALTDAQKANIVFGLYDETGVLIPARAGDAITSGAYEGWVSYDKMNGGTYTWENLDVNKQYYVKEFIINEDNANTATGSTFYGYVHKKTAWTGAVAGETTAVPGEVQTGLITASKNGAQVSFTNVYEKVNRLAATKLAQNYSSDKVGMENLPVWHFTITVNNVGAASMSNNQTVITDIFDGQNREWFKLVEETGFTPAITQGEKVALTATDNGDGTAQYVLTLQEGAPAYQTVVITYYLQPKDFATFQKMLEDTNHKTVTKKNDNNTYQATWKYTNTITYYPLPNEAPVSVSADYFYNTDMVTKTINAENGNMEVTFTLRINPDGLYIGENDRLLVLDKMSDNVEVNMSSFVVNPATEAANVKISRYDGADWDIQIEVPNGKRLEITYTATIKDPTGNVHVTNKVSMEGVVQEVGGDVEFEGGNSGSMSVGAVSIFKYGDTYTVPLQGATFSLYQCENGSLESITPTWQADFTTNEYGIAAVQSWKDGFNKDFALQWDILYYLVEKSAPDGYEIIQPNNPVYFRIYENEADRKTNKQGEILDYYVKTGTVFERANKSYEDEVVLAADKTLIGRDLEKDQFSFQLLDSEGHVLQTKQNAADGTVTFDKLTYTYERFTAEEKAAGKQVHTYTIKEVNGNAGGYTYDDAEYTVTVTVSIDKDANGKITGLTATPVYTLNGNAVNGAAFTNHYDAQGQYVLTGTKTVEGATVIRDSFDFLIEYGDKELCTVSTPEYAEGKEVEIPYPTFEFELISEGDESVSYDDANNIVLIKLKRESLGNEYLFTIDEVEDESKPYGYSPYYFELKLSAEDNGDGTLEVDWYLSRDDGGRYTAALFHNTYLGALTIQKNVTVGGEPTNTTLADGTYTFGVYQHKNAGLQPNKTVEITITNGVSNTATVTDLHGDWTWYIRELSSTNPDVSLVYGVQEVYVPGDKLAEVPTVPFTNNLGVGDLSLTKTVEGTTATDVEFNFTIEIKDVANKTYETTGTSVTSLKFGPDGRANVTLKAGETITIEGLPIGAEYSIAEKNVPDGYTAGTITNGEGVIVGGVTEAEQVNNYSTTGTGVTLKAKKVMTGNAYTGNFTFVLTQKEQATATNNAVTGDLSQTVAQNGIATWSIAYDKAGTYTYTISETKGDVAGMVYDETVYNVEVVVSDNGKGELVAEVKVDDNAYNADAGLTFTNKYSKITFQPEVTKALDGQNIPDETYEFQLLENDDVIDAVTVNGADTVSFDAITKHADGTYTYTIKEVKGKTPGMTYSGEVITYTVVVSRDETTGELTKTESYTGGTNNDNTITNTYEKPEGSAVLAVTKAMSGDAYNGNATFEFTLTGAQTSGTNNVLAAGVQSAYSIEKNGVAFWRINYDTIGEYSYTIKETKGNEEGIVYDETVYNVKVIVAYTDDGMNLATTVVYENGEEDHNGLLVTNQYGETSYQPRVQKALLGNKAPEETYNFVLKGAGMKDMTASVTGAGTATFAAITYKTPGTYTYTITETAGNTEGMTYSEQEITLSVKVVRAENGSLYVDSATYTGGDGEEKNTITNIYREVRFAPQVSKLVTGTGAPEDATFTFQLKEGEDLVGDPVTIKAGETATFKEIVKYEVGTYRYTITEVKGNVPGMAYDTADHKVTVTVSEDVATKELSCVIKYDTDKDALTVTNTYETVKAAPYVKKALSGNTNLYTGDEEFSFTLKRVSAPDGAAAFEDITASCVVNGTADFAEINYIVPGTYVYEITENVPDTKTPGMAYSAEKITYTVVIKQAEDASNKLTVESQTYTGANGGTLDTITNQYSEVHFAPQAGKKVDATTEYALPDEDFTFVLTTVLDDGTSHTETKKVKNGQMVTFGDITYHEPGTYTITITEQIPETKTPGMTYSETPIVCTVTVNRAVDGTLTLSSNYTVDGWVSNAITNIFEQPEGKATLNVKKLLSGNTAAYNEKYADVEYSFVLSGFETTGTNNVLESGVETKQVKVGDSASWTIEYDLPGEYTYTIQETEPKEKIPGMVYDTTAYTVTVVMGYADDGMALECESVTYNNDADVAAMEITNRFSEISFQPRVIKSLAGLANNTLEEVFTFGLTQLKPDGVAYTDEAYALIAHSEDDQTNVMTQEAIFQLLTYNEPGTYQYEIVELAPEEGKATPGMTYSEEIIIYTVVVDKDEATGKLTITSETYEGGTGAKANTISNTYVKPDGMALIMVKKLVTGNNTKADIEAGLYDPNEKFTFTLAKTTQVIVPSDTNDVVVMGEMEQQIVAGGRAAWGLTFDQPGVYTYTVTETAGATDGMEYDETVYNVTITVDYNSDESGLVAKVSYDNAKATTVLGEMEVNNKFSAISFQPEIQKTLTGRFLLPETFDFVLTQVATDDVAVSDPAYTETISIAIDPESKSDASAVSKTAKFTELVYHEPGTYQYQIVEVIPEAQDRTPGMTYSEEIITYTVVVEKDETTGALSITSETYTTTPVEEGAAEFEGNTFTNSYARPEGEAEIFVNKAMTGNEYDGLNKFAFKLSKFDPNAVPEQPEDGETDDETDGETGTDGENGNGDELVPGDGLVSGDSTIVPIGPGESDEGGTGTEDGSDDETGSGAEDDPEVPTVPSIKPPVKPGAGEMEPLVPMETNNLIFPGQLQTIGVDETAKWTIKYDMPGTYEYTLQEILGDEAGVEYDQTIYHVTVVMDYLEDEEGNRMSLVPVSITYTDAEGNVIVVDGYTDPEEDDPATGDDDTTGEGEGDVSGGETTEPTEPGEDGGETGGETGDGDGSGEGTVPGEDGETGEGTDPGEGEEPEVVKPGLTITNKYSKIEFVPEVDKIVDGRGAPREYFTFQLTDGQGYWDTARCLDGETASFTTIVYHEPGTYTYTITELEPERKTYGMSYSDEIITVTVVVERNDETGELTLNTSYTGGATFENTYNPPPTYDYKFSFTKKWQGNVESTLEWTLYDADGRVVHKKFNKDVISETEWYYEAWFASDKGYYLIEDVPEGYEPIYINVGEYADVTDRLYNGGTIINYTVPATGDDFAPAAWTAAMLFSAAAMVLIVWRRKRTA